MATKEDCDAYAAELTQRFEDLTKWAMQNWPKPEFPLLRSDFDASRKEIGQIVGAKLGEGDGVASSSSSSGKEPGQFVDMNPMPWP